MKKSNTPVLSVLICGGLLAVVFAVSPKVWRTQTSTDSIFHPMTEPVALAPCMVAPLPPIEDGDAVQFETAAKTVDVDGMRPAAGKALAKFQAMIEKVGGTVKVNSAYRPQAYQQHLRQVWLKWMNELKDNKLASCQDLRAQVETEFRRHHLLESQHPVPVSDHTRGLAFDAAVTIPKGAKIRKRKVTVDYLARLAGLRRPAIVADPVHFKLAGGKKANT